MLKTVNKCQISRQARDDKKIQHNLTYLSHVTQYDRHPLKRLRINVLENDTEIAVFRTFEYDLISRVSHCRA